MPIAKVGDINLYYEIQGIGDPLVLIMGYGAHSGGWFAIRDKLAKEYRVIIFDNRGTGRSDKPDIPYTSQMMAGDIVGLLDANHIDQANVFGVSMGGMIAQEFALTYPKRLKNLILGCTSCGGKKAIQPAPEATAFLMALATLPPEEKYQRMVPWALSQDFIDKNPEVVKRYVAVSTENPTPAHGGVSQMNVALTFDSYNRLRQIKAPTLVICGAKDRLMPSKNSKILASRLPGAELAIIENGGHAFYIDSSDEAARIVLQFLRKHS
jgi:pimeloyl-ACP methyl ester carboxylesterase